MLITLDTVVPLGGTANPVGSSGILALNIRPVRIAAVVGFDTVHFHKNKNKTINGKEGARHNSIFQNVLHKWQLNKTRFGQI